MTKDIFIGIHNNIFKMPEDELTKLAGRQIESGTSFKDKELHIKLVNLFYEGVWIPRKEYFVHKIECEQCMQ